AGQAAVPLLDGLGAPKDERKANSAAGADLARSADLGLCDSETRIACLLDLNPLVEGESNVVGARTVNRSPWEVELATHPNGVVVERQKHGSPALRSKTLEIQAREFCIDSRRLDPNDLDVSTVSQRGSCGAAEGDDT